VIEALLLDALELLWDARERRLPFLAIRLPTTARWRPAAAGPGNTLSSAHPQPRCPTRTAMPGCRGSAVP
jgi:hypothetical protein